MGQVSDIHAAQIELWLRTDFGEGIGLSYDLHIPELDDGDLFAMFREENIGSVMQAMRNMCPILIGEHAETVALLDDALREVEHIRYIHPDDPEGHVQFIIVDRACLAHQRAWWNRLDAIAINAMDSTAWRGSDYLATREDVRGILAIADKASACYSNPSEHDEAYAALLGMAGGWEKTLSFGGWEALSEAIRQQVKPDSSLHEEEASALAATLMDGVRAQAFKLMRRSTHSMIRETIAEEPWPFDAYISQLREWLEPQMNRHLSALARDAQWEIAYALQHQQEMD